MNIATRFALCLLLLGPGFALAQDQGAAAPAETFEQVNASVQQKLQASIEELNALREKVADQTIPLSRKLNELESGLSKVRVDYQQASRLLDSRTLDLSNLRNEIKSRQDESIYLSNLLGEYIRNFESGLHIAELQRYRKPLDDAKLAVENSNLSQQEVFKTQAGLIGTSLQRLEDSLGGSRFAGSAVDPSGLVTRGDFILIGPAAMFSSEDGKQVGTAEQRLGSLEPAVVPFADPMTTQAAADLFKNNAGRIPLDPTLGNAHKIEETQDTLIQHIEKGGPVMVPIFVLAGAALLVALYKWIALSFQRRASSRRVKALLEAVARNDSLAAVAAAKRIQGPVGKMLRAGVEHLNESRELIEEVMYETVLSTRLKLQRFLPFVAVSAASAPLLGLLGTVTGIINTFKLITVFGSGDVKMLSGGISEALITTEFGLIVAIPSLLLHAFLSRKARGIVDQMEKAAVSFINQLSKTPIKPQAVDSKAA